VDTRFQEKLRRTSRLERIFAVLLLGYVCLLLVVPHSLFVLLFQLALIVAGGWLLLRVARMGVRKLIWGLRNRLLVAYLFIAVVPVLLILSLAGMTVFILARQLGVYVATDELNHRIARLRAATDAIARSDDTTAREHALRAMARALSERFPGVSLILRRSSSVTTVPGDSSLTPPPPGWGEEGGIVFHDHRFFLWSHSVGNDADVTALVPVDNAWLSRMAPGIVVKLGPPLNPKSGEEPLVVAPGAMGSAPPLPPPANRFDLDSLWFQDLPLAVWDKPGKHRVATLAADTRPSVVLDRIFPDISDLGADDLAGVILFGFTLLFFVVECVALAIGISLTRTITGAVHHLYEGTQRVIEGDFSWRIPVARNDQLAELTTSFNVMTGNVERLLSVAREKERLQSEIEIAREVQNQLYPKAVPSTRTLRLTAICQPARMVSGDYYDYLRLDDNRLVLSMGDVAGKGISAALLMATLQSSLRAQLRGTVEVAAPSAGPSRPRHFSTAQLVSELNHHLYEFTAPEKYATFWLGIYEDSSGVLTYTNAGHLPPVLFRNGTPTALDVNGTIVGAFPFSLYEESRIEMLPGDLLVCYTDGITEPENEYGEMFGDERLIELIGKNAERDEAAIASMIMDAVMQWTNSPELFDDMTLMLARRQ
jgi:sigma-B regulation protein RsbU (phosphoserine phosphatase)